MSTQSSDSESETPSLGSRENFFASETDSYEPSTDDRGGHQPSGGVSKYQWRAHRILHATGTLICPQCYSETQQRTVDATTELTDPELYVPESRPSLREYLRGRAETGDIDMEPGEVDDLPDKFDSIVRELYGDHRKHRYCPNCSYIVWGGILADRPLDEFMNVVDLVLLIKRLPSRLAGEVREEALQRKQDGKSDEKNLAQALEKIENRKGAGDES